MVRRRAAQSDIMALHSIGLECGANHVRVSAVENAGLYKIVFDVIASLVHKPSCRRKRCRLFYIVSLIK